MAQSASSTLSAYGRDATAYDVQTGSFERYRREIVDELPLRRGDVVIDAGCGTGLCLPLLRERVGPEGAVIGVDAAPDMLAVTAANTRMHSSPSRKTSTPISRNATVALVFGRIGSGAPCSVRPCQMSTPATAAAATERVRARIVEWRRGTAFTKANYHMNLAVAAGHLPFFSGVLRRDT